MQKLINWKVLEVIMIVYRIIHKCSEYDIEENIEAVTSKAKAIKLYNNQVKKMINDCGEYHAWCRLQKITLNSNLTQKQLILAIMSDRGFAKKIEELKDWTIN